MTSLLAALPAPLKAPLQRVRNSVRSLMYFGDSRYCPVCERSARRFLPHGRYAREDARCPLCGAIERHRFIWLFMTDHTDLFDGRDKSMLHVAPEKGLVRRLERRLGKSYLTADLFDPAAMVKMDITAIEYPENSFDVIYCSHVLEHVEKDQQAMGEFARVLKPDGWMILTVPTGSDVMYEDWSIVEPEDRLRAFGHREHVRRYSPKGFVERLEAAGLTVETAVAADYYSDEECTRMGLTGASGHIFLCRK